MRVFIINQCATNKGDRAVLYMVLRELLHNGFNPVTVSTSNPAYWHDALDLPDLDVKFVPWGFGKPRKKDACLLSKIFHRIKFILAKRISFPVIRNAFIKNTWTQQAQASENLQKDGVRGRCIMNARAGQ